MSNARNYKGFVVLKLQKTHKSAACCVLQRTQFYDDSPCQYSSGSKRADRLLVEMKDSKQLDSLGVAMV